MIYSASSYWHRKAFADQIHDQVHDELLVRGLKNKKGMFKNKVDIQLKAYFKSRPIDSDNIPAKLYIDGLKTYLLAEDNPRWVGRVETESVLDRLTDERVEIEIIEREEVI